MYCICPIDLHFILAVFFSVTNYKQTQLLIKPIHKAVLQLSSSPVSLGKDCAFCKEPVLELWKFILV